MSTTLYQDERAFSDQFLPDIQAILGQVFIQADDKEDKKHNTDLIANETPDELLTGVGGDGRRWGLRVRRNSAMQYKDEFTICYDRPCAKKSQNCEFWKVLDGWGDNFFYSFCDENEEYIEYWFIGNYDALRAYIKGRMSRYKDPQKEDYDKEFKDFMQWNPAAKCHFMAIPKDEVPGIVVDSCESESWVLKEKPIWFTTSPVGAG